MKLGPTDGTFIRHHIPDIFTTGINPKLIPAFASFALNSTSWAEASY